MDAEEHPLCIGGEPGSRKGWSLDKSGYLPPRQGAYYISFSKF